MAKDKEKQQELDLEDTLPEAEEAQEEAASAAEQSEADSALEKLKQENQALNEKVLRQYAEFDNYKKRTAKEKESMYAYAKGDTVAKIFPVLDIFEQALKTQTEDEAFYKGVSMIYDRFQSILKDLGVTEVPGVGADFDPNLHNAVSQTQSEDFGENVVCQVYQTGYMLGDKVLRPAMVVVANP
jgi:molecular chaperone GrpE